MSARRTALHRQVSGLAVREERIGRTAVANRKQPMQVARRYAPRHAGPIRYDRYLTEPDQWTLQARAQMPIHRFALDDEADTRLYVSEVSGDVVLRTTRRERFWGYLGPVIHWVYFTPLRRNGPVWTELIIWSSFIGCVLCLTGLVWGLWRFSPASRFRLKYVHHHSPYASWMKWHHYAGLLPRASLPRLDHTYISAVQPERGTFRKFDDAAMVEIAHAAMPDVPILDSVWLEEYDGYYYDPRGSAGLPVLRVRYADEPGTWLYLDPERGGIVQRSVKGSRLRRWLYHGLHSLDFPFLYFRRPLWDIVVIGLSIGGMVLSATTMVPAWRRLRRHWRRVAKSRADRRL